MINYGKNKNVLAGNFQKTIRFAARLLERLEYICISSLQVRGKVEMSMAALGYCLKRLVCPVNQG